MADTEYSEAGCGLATVGLDCADLGLQAGAAKAFSPPHPWLTKKGSIRSRANQEGAVATRGTDPGAGPWPVHPSIPHWVHCT